MNKTDAILAAHKSSKANGYAFAVCWPHGEWTVEARKPSVRAPGMSVIECEDGRELVA